jgi:hypothetical protein
MEPTVLNPVTTTKEQIVGAMEVDRRRHLYTADDGSMWMSHRGGMVGNSDHVHELVAEGVLKREFPDCDGCWVLSN